MPSQEEGQPDDGWTHVGKSKGRTREPAFTTGLNLPSRDMTVDDIKADFNAKLKRWRASTCRFETISLLKRVRPDEGWQIEKAICLATGSFSRENWESRKRSMWQFVVFYDLVHFLQAEQDEDFKVFAQEPEFTALDNNFLSSIGIEALDHKPGGQVTGLGEAAAHIAPGTLLFEPFMDLGPSAMQDLFGARAGVFDSAPKLYIGSSLTRWLALRDRTDAQIATAIKQQYGLTAAERNVGAARKSAELAAHFLASRRCLRWPRFEEDPNVLEGLSIYWKEPTDDIEEAANECG